MKKMFVEHWGEVPSKFEFDKNIKTQSYIVGGLMMDGSIKTLEITYDFIMDQIEFPKAKSPFAVKKATGPMDIFAREAFGQPDQKAFQFSIGGCGKLMQSLYSGHCERCKLNMPIGLTIVYGSGDPVIKPGAWHPACFLAEKYGVLDETHSVIRAMPRTLDEMRWRRRSKGSCDNHGGGMGNHDPTKPEFHKWRCGCPNAPWNLTTRMREKKRQHYGVTK